VPGTATHFQVDRANNDKPNDSSGYDDDDVNDDDDDDHDVM